MKKKLMLIINPAAGRGAYKTNLPDALQLLDQGGYRTTVFYTEGRGDATEFAATFGAEYDTVACIGGDGTLSEVLAGMMRLDRPPRIGYIPMGTTNDVATTLDLPKNDVVGAARRILTGTPHPFDVGGFGENEYFAYIAAFGMFTEVSYATPQNQKKALGHLAYVLQGMAQLPKIEAVNARVEYDGGVAEGRFLYGSMSNSTSVAGILRLKEDMVSLGDGQSELVLVREPQTIDGFGAILTSALTQNFSCPDLLVLHTTKASFHFDKPVPWTRDGEEGGAHTDLTLRNWPAPVELIF